MNRKFFVLIICIIFTFFFYSCFSSFTMPVNNPNNNQRLNISDDFETGIIFYLEETKPLIKNKFMVEVYDGLTGDLIKEEALDWNCISSVSLTKSEYIVKTYVIYLGGKIWETKNYIDLINSNVKKFKFSQPFFVTSDPDVVIE